MQIIETCLKVCVAGRLSLHLLNWDMYNLFTGPSQSNTMSTDTEFAEVLLDLDIIPASAVLLDELQKVAYQSKGTIISMPSGYFSGSQENTRTDRPEDRQVDRQAGWQEDRQAGRDTDRQEDRQIGRQTNNQADRHTGRRGGRQTNSQADRQADCTGYR